MLSTSVHRISLDELIEQFLEAYRRQDGPSPEEFAAQHPEWASELRGLLPALILLEQGRPEPTPLPSAETDAVPQQLGEYRIVREIGRGGMGVVYEAAQEALARRVALKLLPAQALRDATQVQRFQREARAAARLHHTNIVPVHGVGEHHGSHYYVMELIDGQGLDRVLQDENDAERFTRVARLGMQAAEALAHAHAQGVLHRDVKPSNLLLDARGNVWLTDFGLARAEGLDDLTATGDVVGTLRYLPPERFNGQTDVRGDVYSLGLTLYELLARRPAFDATERNRLLRQVMQDEAPPLRRLVRGLPRDLETVVMKACQRDPAQRYQTAQELADDLRRYRDGRNVSARRPRVWERGWRWCRRNPVVASLCLAVFLSLVGGLAAFGSQWYRAERQKDRAEVLFARARKAVNECFDTVTNNPIFQEPGMEEARKVLLQTALPFYREFLAEQGDNVALSAELREELARTHARVAYILHQVGEHDEALTAYERAIPLYAELAAHQPNNQALRVELGQCHFRSAQLILQVKLKRGDVVALLRQANAIAEQLIGERPDGVPPRLLLAKVQLHLAMHGKQFALPREEVKRAFDRALELYTGLVDEHPGDRGYALEIVNVYQQRGNFHTGLREAAAARTDLQEGLRRLQALHQERPEDLECLTKLAGTYSSWGHFLFTHIDQTGKETADAWTKSQELFEELSRRQPKVISHQVRRGNVVNNLGLHYYLVWRHPRNIQRPPSAEEAAALGKSELAYTRAMELRRQLAAGNPQALLYQEQLAKTCTDLARLYRATDRPAHAESLYREALTTLRPRAGQVPRIDWTLDLGSCLMELGGLLSRQQKAAEALSHLGQAIAELQGVLKREPKHHFARTYLASTFQERAEHYERCGEHLLAARDWLGVAEFTEADWKRNHARCLALAARCRGGEHRAAVLELETLLKARRPDSSWWVATVYAAASTAVQSDASLADGYANRAMAELARYKNDPFTMTPPARLSYLQQKEFDALRSRPDFKKLSAEFAAR